MNATTSLGKVSTDIAESFAWLTSPHDVGHILILRVARNPAPLCQLWRCYME